MPPLQPPSKVLVTGGNGFIGAWVIHALLAEGYSVRAVVRSAAKAQPLQEHYSTLDEDERVRKAGGDGRLEFAYVEDFVKDGAFDEVVQGVEGICHLASPVMIGNGPADDFIIPAVNGTLNLLRAASLPTSTIKCFIFTSSTASVSRPLSPPSPSSPDFSSFETTVFDESDWSQDVELLKEYKEKGEEEEKIPFMVKYRASKTLAERAAWEWVKEKGEGLGWDLVVMNPPFVFGPPLIRSLSIGASVDWWFKNVVKGDANDKPDVLNYKGAFSYVDVRDYAEANVRGLQRAEAGGGRIIIAAGALSWQKAIDITNSIAPTLAPLKTPLTKGVEGLVLEPLAMRYNSEKSKRVLGLEYGTYEDSVRGMVSELSARGY
ncbi:NAD(P)-binding protein [Coprinellus micaceus]|uniref:NAD(P)-binding protein n=1 Tax=Coprinellus micaceus TaxID=71717 RepID=A0A4Y7T6I2_COPMI|nr:NAD(P)-binding protein [Coprinellus micaceus]